MNVSYHTDATHNCMGHTLLFLGAAHVANLVLWTCLCGRYLPDTIDVAGGGRQQRSTGCECWGVPQYIVCLGMHVWWCSRCINSWYRNYSLMYCQKESKKELFLRTYVENCWISQCVSVSYKPNQGDIVCFFSFHTYLGPSIFGPIKFFIFPLMYCQSESWRSLIVGIWCSFSPNTDSFSIPTEKPNGPSFLLLSLGLSGNGLGLPFPS